MTSLQLAHAIAAVFEFATSPYHRHEELLERLRADVVLMHEEIARRDDLDLVWTILEPLYQLEKEEMWREKTKE